jgi:dihydroflavonol-4-reductase
VAKTLVTGGSGFIGSHLVRALARRGDELRVLLRRSSNVEGLGRVEFERVTGDVTDARSVKRAMKGVDRVFHTAGLVSLRPRDREHLFAVNVGGTRNVLSAAIDAGVERVVHTSSVAAVGPARPGGAASEEQLFMAGNLDIPYVNSKREAEVEAMRFAAKGLDVVCVNPAYVFGPGDRSGSSTSIVRRFLLGRIPAYVEGAINVVDVRDVARGHVLADRKGVAGDRYILAGRNFTFDRLFADLSRIAGLPPPVRIPAGAALSLASAATALSLPSPVTVDEVRSAMQWWTYRNTKARRELGFKPRPHEETLEATVAWHLERLGGRAPIEVSARARVPLSVLSGLLRVAERG